MQRKLTSLDWIALLASVVVGGSAFIAIKFALHGIGPYWMVAGRLSVAAVIMAVLLHGRFRYPTLAEWPVIFLIGVLGWTIPLGIVSWASLYVPATIVGMMMAAGPIFVALLSLVMLREEKLTVWGALGLVVGFAGVSMIILGRAVSASDGILADTEMGRSIWPYVLLLLSVVAFSVNMLVARRATHIPTLTKGVGALFAGGVAGIVFAALVEPFPTAPAPEALVAFAYLAIVNTGFNGVLIYWLLDRTSARFVAQSNYLLPVSTLTLGALILSEWLTPLQYAGILVVVLGIALSERRSRPPAGMAREVAAE